MFIRFLHVYLMLDEQLSFNGTAKSSGYKAAQ